ncbi:hypothetical protein NKG05_20395 [Oerskovia sp. M15]
MTHPTQPSTHAIVSPDAGLVVGPATKGLRLDAERTVADVLAGSLASRTTRSPGRS